MKLEIKDAQEMAQGIVADMLKASQIDGETHRAAQGAVLSALLDDLMAATGIEGAVHVLRTCADSLESPRGPVN